MISPKKWIISQKYGRQGALQVNPLKAKGPQIQPVKALAGGLLNPLIRTALKTKGYRSFSKQINKYVKDLVAKHKKDPGIAKLEGKRLKIDAIKTGLDKSRKDMSKNLFVRKHYFGASSQASGYQKKLKDITKVYLHKRANPKIQTHLAGGLLTKGIRLAYKGVRKTFPKMRSSKTVVLPSGEKTKFDTIRKLALAETLRQRVQKLARTSVKHNKKIRTLLKSRMTRWVPGKATPIAYKGKKVATAWLKKNQYKNIHRYTAAETSKKIAKLEKDFDKLGTYQAKLESTFKTKHATGGLIIGKNIDRSLL